MSVHSSSSGSLWGKESPMSLVTPGMGAVRRQGGRVSQAQGIWAQICLVGPIARPRSFVEHTQPKRDHCIT
jgi:hypothetical protein